MFIKCIEFLGTETQQEEWYKKAVAYEIIGCYAQTELGHGSDVQNL
jgi:acyl-CoA oxidase